jgi:tRNA(Arg) A34 adenosine deaminase TadA
MNDELFMKEAIRLARQGMLANKGGPFGAVIVKNGQIIGRGYNRVIADNDPTAHAEIIAIREACRHLDSFQLKDCTVYASCEPCPMCLGALYWARPARVVYAADARSAANAGFDDQFIYEELKKPADERRLPLEQLMPEEGNKLFVEWRNKADKIQY